MENDDRTKNKSSSNKETVPTTAKNEARKKNHTSNSQPQKTNKNKGAKKKKFRELWRSTNPYRKVQLVIGALVAAGTIGSLVAYISVTFWQNYIRKQESRPHVIISRVPEIFSTFQCDVTDTAINFHIGAMHVWVKNIGKEDAVNALIAGPGFRLVPQKKIGIPFFDTPSTITDEMCAGKISPQTKEFPIYAGQETYLNMVQSVGVQSLMKNTHSVSVTLGGPQLEPQPPTGEKLSGRALIDANTTFEMYAPICVYYFDRDGTRYGSCRLFIYRVAGRDGFACRDTPVTGSLEEVLGNFCDR
jgi:hypothetical protein